MNGWKSSCFYIYYINNNKNVLNNGVVVELVEDPVLWQCADHEEGNNEDDIGDNLELENKALDQIDSLLFPKNCFP